MFLAQLQFAVILSSAASFSRDIDLILKGCTSTAYAGDFVVNLMLGYYVAGEGWKGGGGGHVISGGLEVSVAMSLFAVQGKSQVRQRRASKAEKRQQRAEAEEMSRPEREEIFEIPLQGMSLQELADRLATGQGEIIASLFRRGIMVQVGLVHKIFKLVLAPTLRPLSSCNRRLHVS